jgi:hypothetical protein
VASWTSVAGASRGDEGPAELQRPPRRRRAGGNGPLERRRQQIRRRTVVAVDHGAADGDQAVVVGGVAGVAPRQKAGGDPLGIGARLRQHVGGPAMEAAHDGRRGGVEHGPPQQVMTECQCGAVVREHTGLGRRQGGRQHVGERLVEHRRQFLDAEATRQDGGGPEQQFGIGDGEQCAARQAAAQVLRHLGTPVELEDAVGVTTRPSSASPARSSTARKGLPPVPASNAARLSPGADPNRAVTRAARSLGANGEGTRPTPSRSAPPGAAGRRSSGAGGRR